MTTKAEILDFFCNEYCAVNCLGEAIDKRALQECSKCRQYEQLSALIDSLVKSCPSDEKLKTSSIKYWHGYRAHCDEVENWKKEILK